MRGRRRLAILGIVSGLFIASLPGTANAELIPRLPQLLNLNGATVAINVPIAVSLGTVPSGTLTDSALLGTVTVTASGLVLPGFIVSVSSTTFITGSGSPALTIPKTDISYWSGPATSISGLQTDVPGQATAILAQSLSAPITAFSATGLVLSISTSWNPTIVITIPAAAVAGSYTGTITHSVA